MVDLIISDVWLLTHGWMSFLLYDGSTPLSHPISDPDKKQTPLNGGVCEASGAGCFQGRKLIPFSLFGYFHPDGLR